MQRSGTISRRAVLRGLGTTLALPWLEGLASATEGAANLAAGANASVEVPLRMAFFYVPNGVHIPSWIPEKIGTEFELPSILQPLSPFRDSLNVLTGLCSITVSR